MRKGDEKFTFVKCPFCKSTVEVDIEFARKNERIFCGSCCKSFDIKIDDDFNE